MTPWFLLFCLRLVRLFYPVLRVRGAERLPARGPRIIVANHPNGLLDPLVLRLVVGEPVAFLAKSTLWGNPLGRFAMESAGALPVYRAHEADTRQNDATFARCHALLREGRVMALFPEGKSHDATELLPLKTGAARIAAAAGAPGLHIVPIGLLYEDKATFRSSVTATVGAPLAVTPGEPVEQLHQRIAAALGDVVLQAEDATLWRGIVTVAGWTSDDPDARAFELAAAARRYAVEDPARLEAAVRSAQRYRRVLDFLGVPDHGALDERLSPRALGHVAVLVILAPVALLGAVLGWIPYRIIRPLALRLAGGHEDVVGTLKVLAGMLLLPLGWIAWALAAAVVGGPGVGLLLLVAGPTAGWVALWWGELWDERRVALRGWRRGTDPRARALVAAHRAELVEHVEAALGRERAAPAGVTPR